MSSLFISIFVKIHNDTFTDITSTLANDFDNFDFGCKKPDRVFNGLSIPAGRRIEKKIDIFSSASNCRFAMELYFITGESIGFKMNYKYVCDNTPANLRNCYGNRRIDYRKGDGYVMEITIRKSQQEINNHQAEKLNKEARNLIKANKLEEASRKLQQASLKASESKTKAAINKNREKLYKAKSEESDKKASLINQKALQLLQDYKHQEALIEFGKAMELAKNPKIISTAEGYIKQIKETNKNAKKIYKEGLLLKRNNHLNKALKKFNEALSISIDKEEINLIEECKVKILSKLAKALFKEAWNIELTMMGDPNETMKKFVKAKALLEEACTIKSNPEYENIIDVINIKLGDIYFNLGAQLEAEVTQMISSTSEEISPNKCKIVIDKFQEAMENYRKAEDLFKDGIVKGPRFGIFVDFAKEAAQGLLKTMKELEKGKVDLWHLAFHDITSHLCRIFLSF